MLLDVKHVHLIGIGGTGLSAIALVLLERGYKVSGSDRQPSPAAQSLQQAGAQVFIGHKSENIAGADLVLRSSAIRDENVEVQAALATGIPVLKRVDFLGELMAGQQGIAIAGTHGKTTTTAMIAWILAEAGVDPSYIIGGVSSNLAGNAHAGQGKYFVIEADEYDRMFLGLQPQVAVVTNVEHDHPDCYPTFQDFQQAFREFVLRLEPSGKLVACADNPAVAQLLGLALANGLEGFSYGVSETHLDYRAQDLVVNLKGGFSFNVVRQKDGLLAPVHLQLPGEHNVQNATAAFAVADLLGLDLAKACLALSEFQGTGRRFELRGEPAGVSVIDDYAHHPTEIRATLAAARSRFPKRRIWAVWQPHTYSRTQVLWDDFLAAFKDANFVVVLEIYPARESAPADGFSSRGLVEAMSKDGNYKPGTVNFVPGLPEATEYLLDHLQAGDVVLVLSAGDADQISARLVQELPVKKSTLTQGRSG